jgi:hypothetical protein
MACSVVLGQGIRMLAGTTLRSLGIPNVVLHQKANWHMRVHFVPYKETGSVAVDRYIIEHTNAIRMHAVSGSSDYNLIVELLDNSSTWNVVNINLNAFGISGGVYENSQICVDVMIVNLGRPGETSPSYGTTAFIRINGWLVAKLVLPLGVYFSWLAGDLFFGNNAVGNRPFFGILDDIAITDSPPPTEENCDILQRVDIFPYNIPFLRPFPIGTTATGIKHYWSFDAADGWSGNKAIDLGSVGGWNMPFNQSPSLSNGPVRVLSGGPIFYKRTQKFNPGLGVITHIPS